MAQHRLGNGVMLGLVVLNLVLWLLCGPSAEGAETRQNLVAELLASTAVILMSCSIVLSTKLRFLEPYFGGLDKMYMAHKRNGTLAVLLLVAHFFTLPQGAVAGDTEAFNPGLPMGMFAFIGLLVFVVSAVAPRIPFIGGYIKPRYDRWRMSHKLVGAFFILGIVHSILVDTMMDRSLAVKVYVGAVSVMGILAYFYKLLLFPVLGKKYRYVVEQVAKLNGTAVELTLKPENGKLDHKAGQFLFVGFEGDRILREPHPFTISSAAGEQSLRLAIRASGDFTQHLYDHLSEGTQAIVDGSYGCFDYTTGGDKQIWIAGGIGVTPFLSWLRSSDGEPACDADFFYSLRVPEDALYVEELQAIDQACDRFRLHVSFSNRDGHLTAEKIAEISGSPLGKDVYLCGPAAMTESLRRQLAKLGISHGNMHHEEFNFQ